MREETTTKQDTEKADLFMRLRKASEMYTLISLCTREPYVVCNPETFDDQALLFFTQEDAKKESIRLLEEEKNPTQIAKLEANQMQVFFTSLYTMGVNAIFMKEGEKDTLFQLSELVKRKNMEELPDGKVWIENPQLHLTALYYAQALRRPVKEKEDDRIKELQEEISADFSRGKFIVAAPKEEKGIPLVKMEDDKMYQPVFTDILAFQRFNREGKFRPAVIEAEKMMQLLPEGTTGVVLNPLGVNLPMALKKITQQ